MSFVRGQSEIHLTLLQDLANNLRDENFQKLKHHCKAEVYGRLGVGQLEKITTPLELFERLQEKAVIKQGSYIKLKNLLKLCENEAAIDFVEKAERDLAQAGQNGVGYPYPGSDAAMQNYGPLTFHDRSQMQTPPPAYSQQPGGQVHHKYMPNVPHQPFGRCSEMMPQQYHNEPVHKSDAFLSVASSHPSYHSGFYRMPPPGNYYNQSTVMATGNQFVGAEKDTEHVRYTCHNHLTNHVPDVEEEVGKNILDDAYQKRRRGNLSSFILIISSHEILTKMDDEPFKSHLTPNAEKASWQEVMFILEQNSRALASESERSKIFWKELGKLLDIYKKLCEENQKMASDISQMNEMIRSKQSLFHQLQSRISVQDTTIARLETTIQELNNVSYDGILSVKIPNYSQKKAAAMTGTPSFYSDDFYTDRHGYRMCARVFLNGDGVGKGTHLSIFFALKKGCNDKCLSWPFERRVTFTLLNQAGKDHLSDAFRADPTSSSFQKPVKEMNIASGCPMFVAHKMIENVEEGFLRNDTICLRVQVDPPNPPGYSITGLLRTFISGKF